MTDSRRRKETKERKGSLYLTLTLKPFLVRDYLVKDMIERHGEDSSSDEEPAKPMEIADKSEQELAKEEMKRIFHAQEDSDEEGEDLLSFRKKTKEETEKDEADFLNFQRSMDGEEEKDIDLLAEFWKAKELDDNEKFLRE